MTWLKFQHRTLYTVGHDSSVTDKTCRACSEVENQLHLVTCGVIRTEFWDPIINMLVEAGMGVPVTATDVLITGQLSEYESADPRYLETISIAFIDACTRRLPNRV